MLFFYTSLNVIFKYFFHRIYYALITQNSEEEEKRRSTMVKMIKHRYDYHIISLDELGDMV